jgi:hypothetical protein
LRRFLRVSFTVPPLPVYGLFGRDALLHQLRERLYSGGNLAVCAQDGLAGAGKTAGAIAVTHDPQLRAHFDGGVLWAGLGPEPDAATILKRWALELHIPLSQLPPLSYATNSYRCCSFIPPHPDRARRRLPDRNQLSVISYQ